jgi:hypothetical protein
LGKVYLKNYVTEKGAMIAMCDADLIGKVFTEGKKELDLKRYADFYVGDLLEEAEAMLKIETETIYTANVVGKRSVAAFIKGGLVSKSDVMTIANVPVVHVYKVF